jgi:acyl-CoA synthetase (AMP-forming)/AMP-acid ligase II
MLAFARCNRPAHLFRKRGLRRLDHYAIFMVAELPRLPTGKLYKRPLRNRYWGSKTSRIV